MLRWLFFSLEIDAIVPADLACMERVQDQVGVHLWGGGRGVAPFTDQSVTQTHTHTRAGSSTSSLAPHQAPPTNLMNINQSTF